MEINIDEKQNALVVSVAGRLDAITSSELENAISGYIESFNKTIILDFHNLEYISSAGLRVVLLSAKKLKTEKLELLISGLEDTVKDVFELSGFYSMFKIFETSEAALE